MRRYSLPRVSNATRNNILPGSSALGLVVVAPQVVTLVIPSDLSHPPPLEAASTASPSKCDCVEPVKGEDDYEQIDCFETSLCWQSELNLVAYPEIDVCRVPSKLFEF